MTRTYLFVVLVMLWIVYQGVKDKRDHLGTTTTWFIVGMMIAISVAACFVQAN